jgi:hypothetical protein
MEMLTQILLICVTYNKLNAEDAVRADDIMRRYFESLVEAKRSKFPDLNMSVMTFKQLTISSLINVFIQPTVEEIAIYDFPNIPTIDVLNSLKNIITSTANSYVQLTAQSKIVPNVTYYTTNSNLYHLS